MEGYLNCWLEGDIFSSKYYFILHEETMIYCKTKGGNKLGQVHLSICQILRKEAVLKLNKQSQTKNQIVINTGSTLMSLFGHSEELDKWEQSLLHPTERVNEGLTDEMAKVKSFRTQFDDQLRQLTQKLEGNSAFVELSDDLEKHGTQLCQQINQWLQLVDQFRYGDTKESQPEFQSCIDYYPPIALPNDSSVDQLQSILQLQPIKYDKFYLKESPIYRYYKYSAVQNREQLPVLKNPLIRYNIWADLKFQLNGGQFQNSSMQDLLFKVYLYEPLSFLQRLCEGMQYIQKVDEADTMNDSCLRLSLIVGYVVSQISLIWDRFYIPFKPVLFETFDYEDEFYRFVAEQVETDTTAFNIQSEKFKIQGEIGWTHNFSSSVLNIIPRLKMNNCFQSLILKKNMDLITIELKDIVFQKQYVQISGKLLLTNENASKTDQAEVDFLNNHGELNEISGTVKKAQDVRYNISGQWNKIAIAKQKSTGEEVVIFRRIENYKQQDSNYKITKFGLQLNYLHQWNLIKLPLTDSRFRGDIRAIEYGNTDLAFKESQRILALPQLEIQPQWFKRNLDDTYEQNERYFKSKLMGRFSDQLLLF